MAHMHLINVADVIALVSHLGGPSFTTEDIQWAADISSGQRLLEWLAAQVDRDAVTLLHSVAKQTGNNSDGTEDTRMRALASPIGLYKEELEISQRLRPESESKMLDVPATSSDVLSYELPSTLRARATASEREAEALELHAKRLKLRLNKTKAAAKELKEAISVLRTEVRKLENTTQELEKKLADLSLELDGVVGRCKSQALAQLQDAKLQENVTTALKNELASLERDRTMLAGVVQRLYTSLDNKYESLPVANELQDDAVNIHARLASIKADSSMASNLVAASYVEELERMARQLERDPQSLELLAQTTPPSSEAEVAPVLSIVPDIKAELERAGRHDRLALLHAQERGLDYVMSELRDRLLPRLQRCYDRLYAQFTVAAESEAIVSVLIEELEDVNDAVQESKCYGENASDALNASGRPADLLEGAVTDLLKVLLRSRTDKESGPTVLLGREDVENELIILAKRVAEAQKDDAKWPTELRGRLAELSKGHAPLLSAAYQNSPMNTSPPFAPPRIEAKTEAETSQKAEGLTEAALRLQRQYELSSRDMRKLAAFVDKWAAT